MKARKQSSGDASLGSGRLLAAIAVLAVAFAVFAAIPAIDAETTVETADVGTFEDFKTAVSTDNFKIKLTADIAVNEYVVISKTGELDLNGYALNRFGEAWSSTTSNSTITIGDKGDLTIVDSSKDKTGAVIGSNTLSKAAALAIHNGGKCTVNAGTFELVKDAASYEGDCDGWYTVANEGTLTINDGTFVGRQLTGDGSSMIKSGWYDGNATTVNSNDLQAHAENAEAILTINGGLFKFGLNTVKNDDYGLLSITGGTFSNTTQAVVMNNNIATIDGGVFKASKQVIIPAKYNDTSNKGITNINGGTFEVVEGYYIVEMNTAYNVTLGEVNVKAGAIEGPIVGFKSGVVPKAGCYAGTVKIGNNSMTFSGIIPGTTDIVISEGSVEITGTMNASTANAKISAASGDVVLKDLTITNGTLALDGAVTMKGTVTIDDGASLSVNKNAVVTVSGKLAGDGNVTNNGTINILTGGSTSTDVTGNEPTYTPDFVPMPPTEDDFPGYVPSQTVEKEKKDDSTTQVAIVAAAIAVVLVAIIALLYKSR